MNHLLFYSFITDKYIKKYFFLAILTKTLKFQTKTTTTPFPKEHRSMLLGKQGLNLKNIEKRTGARVQIPCMKNSADIIYITGTKDSTKKVVQVCIKNMF
jgi:rRNA processing protein Krr1/Pno1